ncbi:MAG: GNAT family N-acetyltransferase [Candidatus Tectomicrobia bacterium]|uniref:GNAT family N-acetyltransferase n=1 Tax=Tectimicrobiota bacterium TaxID=2528274 RepID=A0A933GKC2_UNCTE|nr:GNAT family N-acetyltransferase [Candidatus Tectomicrobia bacterium]
MCTEKLSFRYCDYIFRKIKKQELQSYFELRYKFIVERYRWVQNSEDGIEYDIYDNRKRTLYFGGFKNSGELVGGVRLLTCSHQGFMLQNEFKYLTNDHELPSFDPDCIEVTRLVIDSDIVDNVNAVALGLFKIMFRWSLQHSINRVVFVTSERFYRFMKKSNYFVKCISQGHKDLAGCNNFPVILDIPKSMEQLKCKDVEVFEFFHS